MFVTDLGYVGPGQRDSSAGSLGKGWKVSHCLCIPKHRTCRQHRAIRGYVCLKPHRVPGQVLWQTFTLQHSHIWHLSPDEPLLCAAATCSAWSAVNLCSVCFPEEAVAAQWRGLHTTYHPCPAWAPTHGHLPQREGHRASSALLFFSCMRISNHFDPNKCQAKAVGENHIAISAATSGVFNSALRQRCTGKVLGDWY